MKHTIIAVVTAATLVGAAAANEPATGDDALARYIGLWGMELRAHVETFGERGGPGRGTMECRWGLMRAWVDCEMDSTYDALGRYALKIVLYKTANVDTVGAFVTNSFGGGRLYLGRWRGADRLEFRDAWIDPRMKWERQLTTYTFAGDDRIDFQIDVSNDDVVWLPHSSGVYTRRR